jgi:hypothetical protein
MKLFPAFLSILVATVSWVEADPFEDKPGLE